MTVKFACDNKNCKKISDAQGSGEGVYRVKISAIGFIPSSLKFIEAHLCAKCYKEFQKKIEDITFTNIYNRSDD